MTATELILLILGAGIFVVSFIIPQKDESKETKESVSKDQVKELLDEKMKDAKDNVLEMVNETVNYGVEKAERAMERLTNEKILAVSEFSNTVLADINKNKEEVMFLYDMLNDKHENLKEAAMQIEQTTKQANRVNTELKENLNSHDFDDTQIRSEAYVPIAVDQPEEAEAKFVPFETVKLEQISPDGTVVRAAEDIYANTTDKKVNTTEDEELSQLEFFMDGNVVNQGNSNEKILELHRMNKSNVAIAKELGLGVGEVKLVIDLYEGMK